MQTETWPEYLARKKAQAAEQRAAAIQAAEEAEKPKRGRKRAADEAEG